MKHIYKQNLKVLSTQIDMNAELGLLPSLAFAQDNMCEYFKSIDCDGPTMIPSKGCFFVVAKTVIEFSGQSPRWLDNVTLTSQLCHKTKIKLYLDTTFENASGERFATCIHEMCAIDHQARSVKMLNATNWSDDIEVSKEQSLEFSKFDVEGLELVGEVCRRIDSNNIDMYRHVNNIEYAKFMLSLFDLDTLESIRIKRFEIHYIAESRFGEELTIKSYKGDNNYVFMIYRGDKLVNRGILYFDKR